MTAHSSITSKIRDYNSLPDSSWVSNKDLRALTGKSRATVYRWTKQGILPAPVKLGNSQNLWRLGDIRAILQQVEA